MKRITSLFLAVLLLFSLMAGLLPVLALEEEKEETEELPGLLSEEVIYALMGTSGNVDGMYSVCLIDSEKELKTSYFGPFKEIENLSDTQEIELVGDEAIMNVPKGKFYFKSFLSTKNLPWFFDIGYKLDGKEVSAENLGGKSGLLEISLKSRANENVDESFRNYFFMQISISLDAEKTGNIEAEGATIANAGGTKLLTLFGLPGSDLDATVKAEVEDFEMPGISIAAVPFSLADQLGDVKDLTDGLVQLSNAVGALSAGAGQLAGGINALKDGSSQFGEGLMLLSQNSGTLRDGSAQVLDAVNNMGAMLENFSSLSENFDVDAIAFLPATLYSIADNLDAAAGSLETIPGGLNAAIGAFSAALDQIQPVDEGGIAELRINNPGNATLEQLIANYRASMALKGVWETTMGNIQVSGDTATNAAALRAQAISLRAAAAAVENIIASGGVGDISELTNGLSQFAGAYSQLHNGIVQYTQGVDTLAANWGQLYGGMSQLSDGANRLSGGLGQLSAGTAGIPAKIKELMGDLELGEYEPISYLSEKNTNCALVQFVMMTDPIDAPAKEKPELELPPETGFWERFKALFAKADEASDEPAESDAQKSADK
jgi:putative membrane protein